MALPTTEISSVDIKASESKRVQYSSKHVKNLPPDSVTDFKWKNYCASLFRLLHELQNVDHDGYMLSICSDEILRKVSSKKPGCQFLLSKEDRYMIKILKKSEIKVIREMLPNYYCHIKNYPGSLLPKLYGAHVVKPFGGFKVYFAVVSNILDSSVFMHRCYDLKGSLRGRTERRLKVREKTFLKDSDLDFSFHLDPFTRSQLLRQIKFDCEFLATEGIMDYSLLLGFHVKGSTQGSFGARGSVCTDSLSQGSISSRGSVNEKTFSRHSPNKSVSIRTSSISSYRASVDSRSSCPDGSSLENEEKENSWLPKSSSPSGLKVPALAVPISRDETGSISRRNVGARQCYDVSLYFEIVDIFQNYGVRKRIERAYKSLQYDSKSISAINPKAYSVRFQDFLTQVFHADDSDELSSRSENGNLDEVAGS